MGTKRPTVINKIHESRTAMKITQEELAQAVGVTRQTIIAIEKGNYSPSIMLSLKFAKFFDKPLEQLFILKK